MPPKPVRIGFRIVVGALVYHIVTNNLYAFIDYKVKYVFCPINILTFRFSSLKKLLNF